MERRHWMRLGVDVGIVVLVYVALRYVLPLVWPFLFALALGRLLLPVGLFLRRQGRYPVAIACSVPVLVSFGLVALAVFFLGRTVVQQGVALAEHATELYRELMLRLEQWCQAADRSLSLSQGTAYAAVRDQAKQLGEGLQACIPQILTDRGASLLRVGAEVLTWLIVILMGSILFLKELLEGKEGRCDGCGRQCLQRMCPGRLRARVRAISHRLFGSLLAYGRTQGILMLLVGGISTVGLLLAGSKYALLIGPLIGIMDALPVLGSGMVYLPWAVFSLLTGGTRRGLLLLAIFACCQVTREFLEPKLLGKEIGVSPLLALFAMYVGLQLFGVAGFVTGPVGLVLILSAWQQNPYAGRAGE